MSKDIIVVNYIAWNLKTCCNHDYIKGHYFILPKTDCYLWIIRLADDLISDYFNPNVKWWFWLHSNKYNYESNSL